VSRSDDELLDDIAAAITSIDSHLQHGPLSVEIVMDAVAMRLLEVGEAVKSLSPGITSTEPAIKWRDIAGMRDFLAHRYFATDPDVVQAVIDKDLSPLADAVARMRSRSAGDAEPTEG
jgi:uncharacterized protein with HEPN domain